MTEYTPEKVAELVAEARKPWCKDCDHFIVALADALTAVSAERDEAEANHHRVVRLNNDLVDSKILLAEELIGEAAKAMGAAWNNMHTNESLGRQRMLAEVAWTVFEQAHAPTSDEREWVEEVNRALFRYDQGQLDVRGVAAVLRRTVQGEPTDAQVEYGDWGHSGFVFEQAHSPANHEVGRQS